MTELRLLLEALAIEDGQVVPPSVGEVVELPLCFDEVAAEPSNPLVGTVRARAEPLRPVGSRAVDDGPSGEAAWPTLLRGGSWSAVWVAPKRVEGVVVLGGTLISTISDAPLGSAAGRVQRLQLVTAVKRPVGERSGQGSERAPELHSLRDVDRAPRWFDDGLSQEPAQELRGRGPFLWAPPLPTEPWLAEIGVLVHLVLSTP